MTSLTLSVFIVNFGHISQFFLTFVFLTLACISLLGSIVCCGICLQISHLKNSEQHLGPSFANIIVNPK